MAAMNREAEEKWDRFLKIRTSGRDDSRSDRYHHPYEPTPYCVLERLSNSGFLGKRNTLVDYGSGKGRVGLFFSYQLRMHSIGIEYDERIYAAALKNQETAVSGKKAEFRLQSAEQYMPEETADRFYFFNPFSAELLHSVLAKIRESYYQNPRKIFLFFYYPSEEYIALLMTEEDFLYFDEIDCRDLFDGKDPREKILIFETENLSL